MNTSPLIPKVSKGPETRYDKIPTSQMKRLLRLLLLSCIFIIIVCSDDLFLSLNNRELSISLDNGECLWEPTSHILPEEELFKTVIAGFPRFVMKILLYDEDLVDMLR